MTTGPGVGFAEYYLIGIVAFVLSMGIQWWLKSTYARWLSQPNTARLTGRDAARALLEANGLHDVKVEAVQGQLTDHYDPRARAVRLSQDNYAKASVAGIAVAAHEVGHAIQHAKGYAPLRIRSAVVPLANIGTQWGPMLALFGLMLGSTGMLDIGIVLFGGAVLFHLVTLPVEFDASRRALAEMDRLGFTTAQDRGGARQVLNAAALTYVAAAATAIAYLLYFILARRR